MAITCCEVSAALGSIACILHLFVPNYMEPARLHLICWVVTLRHDEQVLLCRWFLFYCLRAACRARVWPGSSSRLTISHHGPILVGELSTFQEEDELWFASYDSMLAGVLHECHHHRESTIVGSDSFVARLRSWWRTTRLSDITTTKMPFISVNKASDV